MSIHLEVGVCYPPRHTYALCMYGSSSTSINYINNISYPKQRMIISTKCTKTSPFKQNEGRRNRNVTGVVTLVCILIVPSFMSMFWLICPEFHSFPSNSILYHHFEVVGTKGSFSPTNPSTFLSFSTFFSFYFSKQWPGDMEGFMNFTTLKKKNKIRISILDIYPNASFWSPIDPKWIATLMILFFFFPILNNANISTRPPHEPFKNECYLYNNDIATLTLS